MRLRVSAIASNAALCSAITSLLCESSAVAETLPLPANPTFSSYVPSEPYRILASGLLARVFSDSTVDGLRIQIVDALIGPSQKTEGVALRGPSTHFVLSGSGQITYAEGGAVVERKFQPGSSWTLAPGQAFRIENQGEQHVDIRIRIITAAP